MNQEQAPKSYSRQELTYNNYLKVDELLNLQQCKSEPAHHDETLFIIIHQAYELWFKQVLHEMASAIKAMEKQKLLRVYRYMDRVVKILRLLVSQIHILETMAPAEFLQFRDKLNPASGFQSIQFREIEFLAGLRDPQFLNVFKNWPEYTERLQRRLDGPNLRSSFYKLLQMEGFDIPDVMTEVNPEVSDEVRSHVLNSLKAIYQNPDHKLRLYLLSESLVEFDEYLLLWRHHHRLTVERVIGGRPGTGGSSGVKYLESTTSKRCFPLLWEVRTYLTKEEPEA